MLGQLQLKWALGNFIGQILSRDFRVDFQASLNIIIFLFKKNLK